VVGTGAARCTDRTVHFTSCGRGVWRDHPALVHGGVGEGVFWLQYRISGLTAQVLPWFPDRLILPTVPHGVRNNGLKCRLND